VSNGEHRAGADGQRHQLIGLGQLAAMGFSTST
jgi:hypothetical protein